MLEVKTIFCAFLLRTNHCHRSSSYGIERVFARNNRSSVHMIRAARCFPLQIRTNTNICHLTKSLWLSLSGVQYFGNKQHRRLYGDALAFAVYVHVCGLNGTISM